MWCFSFIYLPLNSFFNTLHTFSLPTNLYLKSLSYSESVAVKDKEPVFKLPVKEALKSVFSLNNLDPEVVDKISPVKSTVF